MVPPPLRVLGVLEQHCRGADAVELPAADSLLGGVEPGAGAVNAGDGEGHGLLGAPEGLPQALDARVQEVLQREVRGGLERVRCGRVQRVRHPHQLLEGDAFQRVVEALQLGEVEGDVEGWFLEPAVLGVPGEPVL